MNETFQCLYVWNESISVISSQHVGRAYFFGSNKYIYSYLYTTIFAFGKLLVVLRYWPIHFWFIYTSVCQHGDTELKMPLTEKTSLLLLPLSLISKRPHLPQADPDPGCLKRLYSERHSSHNERRYFTFHSPLWVGSRMRASLSPKGNQVDYFFFSFKN